jgi:hypothetical protein
MSKDQEESQEVQLDEYDFKQLDLCEVSSDEWFKFDFNSEMQSRKKMGPTKATIERDIKLWQKIINSLPQYNEESIRNEIRSMNFAIPDKSSTIQDILGAYSRLVEYNFRINELVSTVHSHNELFSKAYKAFKQVATTMFTGTAKDKEGNAEYFVHPFYIGTAKSGELLNYLESVQDSIDFAVTQICRQLKEKEFVAKINPKYHNEGTMQNFQNDMTDEKAKQVLSDTSEVHVRRRRRAIIDDTDDED